MDRPPVDPRDPLAQPTRARLFALLAELKRPTGTAELSERLNLHPNGVRMHLERLVTAGLVERSRAVQPMGRPRDAWMVARDAQPGGSRPSSYADLGRWLARAIPARSGALQEVEAAGREIGRELAPDDASDAEEAMRAALIALGFQPTESRTPGGHLAYRLGNCPYRDAVRENQDVVCTLHRGITRGLLDRLDPRATLEAFVPRDPDAAGCLIEIGRSAPPARAERPDPGPAG